MNRTALVTSPRCWWLNRLAWWLTWNDRMIPPIPLNIVPEVTRKTKWFHEKLHFIRVVPLKSIISYRIISYHIISYHHCTIISGSISMFLCSITIFLGFYSLCSYINHYKSSFSMFCLVVFHVKSPLFYDERSRRSPFQFLDLLPFSSFTSRAEAAPAPRWAGGQALFCDAPSSPGGPVGRMFGRWNGTLKPWEWEFRWNLYDFVD